jgi:ABC-type glycerol-3-phosphate transport system permease component
LAPVVFVPILWLFVTAFKTEQDAVHLPHCSSFAPTLSNFRSAIQSVGPAFRTTLRAVGLSTILAFALGLPAAYALADDGSKWSKGILAWNEFLFALVHSSVNTVTVWVSITSFKSAMGLFIAKMSAASILAIGPVLRSRLGRAAPLGACDGLA